MDVEEVLFDVAEALEIPVLVLALLALAVVVFELGGMIAELVRRRGRGVQKLDRAVGEARQALAGGDTVKAKLSLSPLAASRSMRGVLGSIVDQRQQPGGSDRIAKDLAEFDYASIRRLERTRMLVRIGPALGLMGTLIPLSPALAGLAEGDIETLSDNLRVAFSVTVRGAHGRCDRVCDLARARPALRPGLLGSRVRGGAACSRRDIDADAGDDVPGHADRERQVAGRGGNAGAQDRHADPARDAEPTHDAEPGEAGGVPHRARRSRQSP